jgi:hypothetical protein
MHDWMGLGLTALGIGLVVSAVLKYRSRRRAVVLPGQMRPEFAAVGEIVRPIILFGVIFFAAKMSLFYFLLGGKAYLTPLDYAALMLVLAAYSGYLIAATSKRPQAVPAAEEAEPREAGVRSAA